MSVSEFPILGEPFAVELANTRYGTAAERFDFLGDRTAVPLWFAAASSLRCPVQPTKRWHGEFLELRDATRNVLDALACNTTPTQSALDVITAAANCAVRRRTLVWNESAQTDVHYEGSPGKRELAALGDAVIDFLSSDLASLVRICAALDCTMLFVRHHHRRRWCHEGCSHRDRQARYYRRHKNDNGR